MAHVKLKSVDIKFPVSGVPLKRALLNRFSIGSSNAGLSSFHALKNITLELNDGDRLAIMGNNGAGKTTMLRTLAGIYEPYKGTIRTEGKVTSLISVTAGLEQHLSGRENIKVKGAYMGLSPEEVSGVEKDIIDFSDIGEFIEVPIKKYSSGMLVRLAFAISTAFPIEILLLDEWLSAGDKDFADKSEKRMHELVGKSSIMVLASHSMTHLQNWCNKALILKGGVASPVYNNVNDAILDYEKNIF